MPMPEITDHIREPDRMERDLWVKAYNQGRTLGQKGLKISMADWEEEFLPAYRAGYDHGTRERDATTAINTQFFEG